MEKTEVIKSIGKRSGGDIYLGVVGAVRTGKSTFIRKFMENLIIPNITDEYEKKRCLDELPQAAAGKTIMTTEPKFIPSTATKIEIEDFTANIRMIDCVGYIVPSAKGYEDENGPRLVMTPWYQEPIPFIEAAEIGTEKVIKDHSTIGIVVTTDGSIGEIPRNEYLDAEKTVIEELESIGKPYIVLLNSTHPMLPDTERLADKLKDEYKVPVLPINIETMQERDMYNILKAALYEFPIEQIKVNMPEWIAILKPDHYLKKEYINRIKEEVIEVRKQYVTSRSSGARVSYSNGVWSYSNAEFDLLCAITAQECSSSYEGALAVITTACNRAESTKWAKNGSDPLSQYKAPGQFCYSIDSYWKRRLNGNYSSVVAQAVTDALKGKRNHNYLSFRSAGYASGEYIGGNVYFNAK